MFARNSSVKGTSHFVDASVFPDALNVKLQ